MWRVLDAVVVFIDRDRVDLGRIRRIAGTGILALKYPGAQFSVLISSAAISGGIAAGASLINLAIDWLSDQSYKYNGNINFSN